MPSFNRTLFYTVVVFVFAFYQLTNSQEVLPSTLSTTILSSNTTTNITNPTTTIATPIDINSTVSSTTSSPSNNLTNSSNISETTTLSTTPVSSSTSASIPTVQSTTSDIGSARPPKASSGPGWRLVIILGITMAIVIIAGAIVYNRQQSPYRRFLRNWRSRDDDTDNIILQLEQPELTNGQWPPRISFA